MLIHELSETEQAAFLQLASRLSEVDGIRSPLEDVLLQSFERTTLADGGEDWADQSTEALCEAFETRRAQVATLLELTALGHIDDAFTANESLFLEEIAEYWEMSEGALERADEWARKQHALVDDAGSFWD